MVRGKGIWRIRLTSHAERDLDHILKQSLEFHRHLIEELKALEANPFPAPPKAKKLRGLNGIFWRLRVGAFRVVYRPLEPQTLLILRITPPPV